MRRSCNRRGREEAVSRHLVSGRYRDRNEYQMPAWQNLYLWILSRFQAEQTRVPRQRVSSGNMPTRRIFWEYFSLQQAPLELPKTLGKQLKVRFLSSPQDCSTF